ncbi:MAG: hypothetical protein JWM10_2118, partial [Myxococcaceae bacterium]|nr:hypothetical protein [Myxococcaceae bacterium]
AADATPPADGATLCEEEPPTRETLSPTALYLTPGARVPLTLRIGRDRCAPVALPARSATTAVATMGAASVTVGAGQSTATVDIIGVAPGTSVVSVGAAMITVTVLDPALPACPATTPTSRGMLRAGQTVRGAAGGPLEQVTVALPAAATEITPVEVELACAADQVPDGFVAVGPAVRFGPDNTRLRREIPFTVPVNAARVPPGYELQVQLAYTAPAFRTARVVPVADVHLTNDGRAVTFKAPRLGTWQAVIRSGLGTRHTRQRFTFHSILGVSMGAAGAGMIGMRNLDLFDHIAPLGGPVDWNYLGHYIHDWHVGGFCTAAQRAADPTGCAAGASVDRTPPSGDLYERRQHFEEWFFPDGWEGQGGTFDRQSYIQIFRDLTRMFGNAVTPPGASGVLPRGVPDAELTRTDAERCNSPVTLMNYYDREYNPDGALPVVTFCDGTHPAGHAGRWDGTRGNYPMEVSLAVDVNSNGRRDAGEPVLRRFFEAFRDVGADGLASAAEPGFNALTNPDPAQDDYDRQFNPAGTEGNFQREEGETFDDLGIDGVACPAGRTCEYDVGEGNGRWDQNPGWERFTNVSPRTIAARTATAAQLARVAVWADGGVHDLFNFATVSNHFVGGLAQRGMPVHYYNNFAPLGADRLPESPFPHDLVDYAHMPSHVMLRYGNPDATMTELVNGDGGHVGTIPQITSRLYTSLFWMAARWPGGDRRAARYSTEFDNAGRCANGYFCTFDFRSDRSGRNGPVSVYLPPGYHDPENANVRYPVVYFLHGYGQQPSDLVATGLIVGNFMALSSIPSWRRPQKFIMVFPDGRCREQDRCLRGTFYTDSPVGNAQMETYFLDLYQYIDRSYRVRTPEEVDVVD